MEVVELKVQVDKSQLTALDKEINALKSKKIKISVDASGFNALNKSTLQSMRSVTQYVNAVSRAQAQENKLSLAREKTAQATQRRITSENRLAAQIEKTKTTQAQATAQAEKTAQAQARLQTQIERTRTAQAQYATQAEKTATAQAKAATQTEKVSKSTSLLGDSLGNVALKMAAWQVMGDLVATPIRALKEALSTMKDVDTELVNIQKVTGNTGTEMEALSERAFQMASEYGRTATEVTQAMTEFARAGYGDQLEQMAEMSILLQNIGDVSSETANSMLLAVDAAWGFGGSEEKLMSVMDGLNEITNKNATDMDKLATGMTVAASVFAESGESVQTFASMLGAGTAVTQRSGSEIARGLRTIMMNIRQIRGETEDGELIDGESIANASKALKEFAGISTMENGELRLASDVLDELADKWDNLDTVQQSAIAEALAGKRQANVLTSLIANWDMVEKQMKEYASGAGSALQENEIYMDSWEAKLNQLSSKWTEFISHLVDSDAIKTGLDGITSVIDALDSDVGAKAIEFTAITAAITGLAKAGTSLKKSNLGQTISSIFSTIGGMTYSKKDFTSGLKLLGETLSKSPVAWAAVAAGAFMGLEALVDALTTSLEEQQEIVADLESDYESLAGADSELTTLREMKSAGQELTDVEEKRLSILEGQERALKAQLNSAKKEEHRLYSQEEGMVKSTNDDGQMIYIDRYRALTETLDGLNESLGEGTINTQEFEDALGTAVEENRDFYNSLLAYKDEGVELFDWQEKFIDQYEELSTQYNRAQEGLMGLTEVEKKMSEVQFGGQKLFNADEAIETLIEYGATAQQAQKAVEELDSQENVVALHIEGDPKQLVEDLQEIGIASQQLNKEGKIDIDVSALVDTLQNLNFDSGSISAIISELSSLENVNLIGISDHIKDAFTAVSNFEPPKISTSVDELIGQTDGWFQSVKNEVDEANKLTATPKVDANVAGALAGIGNVESAMRGLKDKTVTITTIHKEVREGSGSVLTGTAKAEGDTNYPGGVALLGDEYAADGSPRPELVITRGRAYLAGQDGPEFQAVPSGARILPYKETKEILDRSAKPSGQRAFPAFASGNSKDAHLEELEGTLGLLQGQYDFLESSGADKKDLIAKSKEIQRQLHTINEYLRKTGGEEKDIVGYSTDWWDELEKIKETQQDIYQDQRDLLQSEIDLMENQGDQTGEKIEKLRQIQDSLHQEAEFLRSIGADQKEINELSNEWWEIHQDILSVQEDLWSELEDAVDKELERAAEARDLELDALDKELKRLDAEREAKEEKLELEEKTLAVQEAQAALANAQNERTIRTYNAASGQWEWVADADTVKDAEEALEDAQEDLEDYKEDLEYQAAVDAIEARREAIEKAYENLEEGWEDIIDSVQEPTRSISEILADLAQNGTPLMKQQVDNVGKLLGDLNNYIRGAIGSETGESYYGGGGTPSMDFSHDTTDYHALMERASDEAEFNHWAKLREEKMKAQGIDPEASGLKTNAQIYEEWKNKNKGGSSGGGGSSSGGSSSGGGKVVGSVNGKAPPGLSTGDKVVTQGGTYEITGVNKDGSYTSNKVSDQTKSDYESSGGKYDKYDSGGVLRGLGGIKATEEDEMILPPDITAAMLTPAADATFQARLAELGVLYGAKRGPLTLPAGMSQNRDSHDHHGDSYTFGDVTLTEEQARGMTVYDLAQKSRSLGLYGWRH